ncbi:MAG: TonB-dependent receptor, partial [Sphingopyxis sp.]
VAGLAGCAASLAAHAATPGAQEATPIEEIIVTAQKKDERLSDTPLAISALPAEQLQTLGVKNFADFATYVPGISYASSGAGQTQVNLRGITTGISIAPTVGIYVDDVPYGGTSTWSRSASIALDAAVVDLERIEVLRGPQGTLYGASTMGGLIKYVTRKPDLERTSGEAGTDLSVTGDGGFNYDVRGAVNLPFGSDQAAIRASGYELHDDGYIDNVARKSDANRADTYGGRLDLLLFPTEQLAIRLTGFAQNIRRDGRAEVDKDLTTHRAIYGELAQSRAVAEPFDQDFRLVSGTLEYDFGSAKLTSISSYQRVETSQHQDVTRQYGPLFAGFGIVFPQYEFPVTTDTKKFAQELRLASTGTDQLEWLVGAFYTDERNDNDQALTPRMADGSPAPLNLLTAQLPSKYEEIAGFGDLTYHFTPRFDVALGVRVARNKQAFEQIGSSDLMLISSIPEGKSAETVDTYVINPRFHVNDNLMIYARAASGYRPGGPNAVLNDPATGRPLADATFDADTLWSYEGGLKGSTADHRFAFDAAIFFIDWDNLQIATVRNGFGVIANAGTARSQGAEVTLTVNPADALRLMAVLAYTDAELTQDAPDLGGVDGARLPDVPRLSAALTGDYRTPVG